MITELVGRLQTLAWVKPLTNMQMIDILEQQEVPKWVAMFKMVGCKLTLHRGALSTCAERAKEEATGVRGAAAFLRRGMEDIYTEASKNKIKSLTVTRIEIETGRVSLEVEAA
jgi:ATP-dependent protease Clp ATPase subunit